MNNFTNQYKTMMTTIDFTNLSYWDLLAALRLSKFPEWGLDKSTVQMMQDRHQLFVTQAFKAIGTTH